MNFVEVKGGTKKEREVVQATISWCLRKLLPRVRTLDIEAKLTKCNAYGYCLSTDRRNFELEIRKGMNLFDLIATVCHEMVHVKQYAKDELKETWDGHKWKSKKVGDVDYMDQPWEKEAFRLEESLAMECFKELKVSL